MVWDSWGTSWGVLSEAVPPVPPEDDSIQDPFYLRMQATATRLLAKYKQGSAVLRRATVAALNESWTPNQISYYDYPLTVIVEPVFKKFIDNTLVFSDSRMVIFQKIEVEPQLTDQILLGSRVFEVSKFLRYPAAGIVVYYAAVIGA